MQNAFSPASKSLIIFHSLNIVSKFKVLSETHGNLLTITFCKIKIKQQITNLQYTMAQKLCSHSKREEKEHSEDILAQSKPENELDKLQCLLLQVWCESTLQISNSFHRSSLQHTSLSWADSVLCSRSAWQVFHDYCTFWDLQWNPGFPFTAPHFMSEAKVVHIQNASWYFTEIKNHVTLLEAMESIFLL